MPAESHASHWNAHAKRWALIGAPLRPAAMDIEYLKDSVNRLAAGGVEPRTALLLGVTPEIAEIVWEPPLQLLAVDQSEGMVRGVWPGDTQARRAVIGDWLALQPAQAAFDIAMGDGVFSLFALARVRRARQDYPSGYARLASALVAQLKPNGLLSVRLFCRPERAEPPEAVFRALFAGEIGNFHIFKWRLAMAVQGGATRGVRVAELWSTFERHAKSAAHVAEKTGWPEPVIATIEGYRDVEDRYTFSTEREVVDVLSPAFELVETWRPSYELGERCPHLSFRKRP